jgi:hypothetical protein
MSDAQSMSRSSPIARLLGRLLLPWLLLFAPLLHADGPLDGAFEIATASSQLQEGVVELNAQIHYPSTGTIREALRDGVTLAFDLEISVKRPRHYWFDADIVALNLRRELSYHVISDRYVVRGADGVEQSSYPTLESALEQLGQLERFPIVVAAQLRGEGPWEVALRAGIRRGRMPDALRALMFWRDDWHRTSDWYTWTLER